MTGVGGIYPFEDHQLDKTKISEFFNGNFHEVLYPVNYSSVYGPWQFHHPPDHRNFIDLSTITWNGKIRVINKKSPSTAVTDSTNINCSVVNNFIHSAISRISYQLNDASFGDSTGKSYAYRSYFDNILSFSAEAKKQSLKYHGFIRDSNTHFDDVTKARDSNSNDGFEERADMFCTSNFFLIQPDPFELHLRGFIDPQAPVV